MRIFFYCQFGKTSYICNKFNCESMNNSKNKVSIAANANAGTTEYRFNIDLYVFQSDGEYVAYCPSLDITETGETYSQCLCSFYEKFQIYVEWCVEHGTLLDDLRKHGWKILKTELKPPSYKIQMGTAEMKRLFDNNVNFERIVSPMRIAL